MTLIPLKCPQCQASLEYDIAAPYLKCGYCGTNIYLDALSSEQLIENERSIALLKKQLSGAISSHSYVIQDRCYRILGSLTSDPYYMRMASLWRVLGGEEILTKSLLESFTPSELRSVSQLVKELSVIKTLNNHPIAYLGIRKYLGYVQDSTDIFDDTIDNQSGTDGDNEDSSQSSADNVQSDVDEQIKLEGISSEALGMMSGHHTGINKHRLKIVFGIISVAILAIGLYLQLEPSVFFPIYLVAFVLSLMICGAISLFLTPGYLEKLDVHINTKPYSLFVYQDGVILTYSGSSVTECYTYDTMSSVAISGNTLGISFNNCRFSSQLCFRSSQRKRALDIASYIGARINKQNQYFGG